MSVFLSRTVSACVAIAAMLATGCASWKEPPTGNRDLPLAGIQENKKQLVLEIEFVNAGVDREPDHQDALWQWIDETKIDVDLRRRLLANGIRVGLVANEERFRQRLAGSSVDDDVLDEFLSQASIASEVSHGSKRIPMRLGRRYELPLRQPIEGSHVPLIRIDGETIGRTLQNAQYLFAVTPTRAASPKQIRLRLLPEIQHGDVRQKWISSDSALRIDNQRETWSIPELDLNVTARENDVLVIAPSAPISGLGKQMLTGTGADHDHQQVMVLIRVARLPAATESP